jgi:hypothetical protein
MHTTTTSSSVMVIVSGTDGAASLRRRLPADAPVTVFADSEALHAADAVHASRPKILLLDPLFVGTARGAALVAEVRDATHLIATEVRVLTRDDLDRDAHTGGALLPALLKGSRALDQWGTRATPRFAVRGEIHVVVNGEAGELVDLSSGGAQVVAAVRLAPGQPVRLVISDAAAAMRCRGQVAWCFLIPSRGVSYRAGVVFQQADAAALESLCLRHGHRL